MPGGVYVGAGRFSCRGNHFPEQKSLFAIFACIIKRRERKLERVAGGAESAGLCGFAKGETVTAGLAFPSPAWQKYFLDKPNRRINRRFSASTAAITENAAGKAKDYGCKRRCQRNFAGRVLPPCGRMRHPPYLGKCAAGMQIASACFLPNRCRRLVWRDEETHKAVRSGHPKTHA